MRPLIDRLRLGWEGRTVREQRMLAVMAVMIATTLVWLLVIRPVGLWREAAAQERLQAQSDLFDVKAGVRQLSAVPGAARASIDAQGLEPLVRQTAATSGLEITTGMDPSGRLGFRISNASSASVFTWLATLQTAHGITVRSLGVVENTDATLQVEGSLSL